jgi:hypothetical protein
LVVGTGLLFEHARDGTVTKLAVSMIARDLFSTASHLPYVLSRGFGAPDAF